MPIQTPPQQPVQYIPAEQQQQQDQQQNQAGEYNANFRDESLSESQSESRSEVIQSPINSQTNITNNNSDHFGFGVGITRPVPTLWGSVQLDQYDERVQIGFTVPIGGRSAKLSDDLISNKIKNAALNNATAEMSFCNSLYTQNIEINYSMLPEDHPAHTCNGLIIKKTVVAERNTSGEIDELKEGLRQLIEQNQKLQVQNQKLRVRLEQIAQDTDNPFSNDGG